MRHASIQLRGSHPPKSNAERQAEFRQRNPGYYKQYRLRMKVEAAARLAQRLAATQAVPIAIPAPAPGISEGVWITLPALVPVPVEAAKPEAAPPMVMRVIEESMEGR